ncbi:MAG: hypothetical protein GF401_14295 [Chitinivibrionales bacterium]|nr:hypothetical protein [Chitinivibrionales bacterium]
MRIFSCWRPRRSPGRIPMAKRGINNVDRLKKNPRILIILPNNLGDVIMATPVLEGLKARDPDCSIDFLVEQGFEAGIENNPRCDRIIRFSRKEIRDWINSGKGAAGLDSLKEQLQAINSVEYDTVYNLCQHSYVSSLMPLIAAKEKRGRQYLREGNHAVPDTWSQYLYAIPWYRPANNLHATDVYRRIASVKEHGGGYSIFLTRDEKEDATRWLDAQGIDCEQEKIMIFQPGAAFSAKRWPVEHFVALGRMLVKDGWRIVVTGALAELDSATGVQQGIGEGCTLAAGATTFRKSMAIISFAKGCITGDTAAMHAAAALNVPLYALFGPTNPVETGPWGKGHYVFSSHCTRRPCFCTKCKSMLCMKSILPETIYSCIRRGTPGNAPTCDIYITKLHPHGDYRCVPTSPDCYSYYDTGTAALTRAMCGDRVDYSAADNEEPGEEIKITGEIAKKTESMAQELKKYLLDRDTAHIKEYEALKSSVGRYEHIGAFWFALLNIRLNSVPLLDPVAGVEKSSRICRNYTAELRRLASPDSNPAG